MNGKIEVEISSNSDDGVQGKSEGKNKAIADRILQFTKYTLSYVDTPANDNYAVDGGKEAVLIVEEGNISRGGNISHFHTRNLG